MIGSILYDVGPVVAIVCVLTLLAFSFYRFGYDIGRDEQKQDSHDEAVKEGHAEYYLDENSERQWRWKDLK